MGLETHIQSNNIFEHRCSECTGPARYIVLGGTLRNCPSQTTILHHILRHILRHTLCPSHLPLHHPTPPTPSVQFTFHHTVGNSIFVECLYFHDYLHHSPSLSPLISVTFHDKLCHGLRHILYHSIVLPLSLFFYIYNLTLILAEVLSYSFRTSC